MRLSSMPSSIRKVVADVAITGEAQVGSSHSYMLCRGEYVRISHDLHMRDPKYFTNPETFNPERFLVQDRKGSQLAEMGTIRPYGAGSSICKGRIFAEMACLSLVAGVLVCWDIEPGDKSSGWVIPKQDTSSVVCRPVHETRVRIRQRTFKWGN
jgi:cytochrome P450